MFGVSRVLPVDPKALIGVEGHGIVTPMRHRLREVDEKHLSVLHDEVVQLEWGVLRDAEGVDFAYAVHRETTNKNHVTSSFEKFGNGYETKDAHEPLCIA